MAQKWGHGGFNENLIDSYIPFYVNMKVLAVL